MNEPQKLGTLIRCSNTGGFILCSMVRYKRWVGVIDDKPRAWFEVLEYIGDHVFEVYVPRYELHWSSDDE